MREPVTTEPLGLFARVCFQPYTIPLLVTKVFHMGLRLTGSELSGAIPVNDSKQAEQQR